MTKIANAQISHVRMCPCRLLLSLFFFLSMPTANRRRCDHPLNPGGPLRRPPRQHREHSAFRSDLPNTVVTALIRLMNCLPRSALRPVLSCNGVLDSIDGERSLPRVQPPPCHDSAREPVQAASRVMSVAQAWFGRSIVDHCSATKLTTALRSA